MTGFGDLPFGSGPFGGDSGDGGSSTVLYLALGSAESDATFVGEPFGEFAATGDATSDATATFTIVRSYAASGAGASDATFIGARVIGTGVLNRVGGRRRLAEAVATWQPAVVPAPVHIVEADGYDQATAFGAVTMVGAQPTYDTSTAKARRARYRILVGSTDVTYFRGVPTPHPTYQLVEPLLYGAATLTFPQIAPPLEHLGVGPLKWLKPGKPVMVQRVVGDEVVATDYIGIVIGLDVSGSTLTVQCGGEASGRAALMNRQLPIFNGKADIGRYAYGLVKDLGLPFTPHLGPATGISLGKFGGMSMLDYASELCARGWTRAGAQWTIMPDAPEDGGRYRMVRKDTATIHGTVFLDDTRTVGNLRRDVAEEPNRIFVTGVTPEGMRVRNGVYPGLNQGPAPRYPMDDDHAFGIGTTDAGTDTGDGVTVMINRLQVTGYLSQRDNPGGYDADVVRAIKALQDDASDGFFASDGVMRPDTWDALFDLKATGYSLNWSHIEPMAEDPRVRKWRRSSSGAVIGRNRRYQADRLKVDVNVDMGAGFKRDQMREWANTELDLSDAENWVGTIRFNTGALIRGHYVLGDLVTEDVMPARDLRPGMNLRLPLFNGGITVHVSGVGVDAEGVVEAMVDTRARDALKVWQIIARNREARSNPARLWLQEHRASTMLHDSITEWDEFGGRIPKIRLPGSQWTVFPVVAGQAGIVQKLMLRTEAPTEYVVAVFGKRIYPSRLQRLVGNPLTKRGSRRFNREDVLDQLDAQNVLLYVAGSDENPCGYYPKAKTAEGDESIDGTFFEAAPLTGRWEDEAGFSYHTFADPVLYVAIYPANDTTIPAGRIMENQQTVGA